MLETLGSGGTAKDAVNTYNIQFGSEMGGTDAVLHGAGVVETVKVWTLPGF